MSGWDFFNTAAGAASLMGLVLGLVLGVVSWRSTRATLTVLERMDQRADERHRETLTVLDRIDARAEDRHREARG